MTEPPAATGPTGPLPALPTLHALTPALRAAIAQRLRAPGVQALPAEGRRHAAVALAIVEAGHGAALPGLPAHPHWDRAAALLLTRRASTLRSHAGQWALPGGRLDAGETAEQAALRELHEELGLDIGSDAVLGQLDDYGTRSGYVVTPVVVWAGAARALRPHAGEVASVHRLPLAELLRADAPILNTVRRTGRTVLRMPLGTRWIAAPTAAFLYQFREWVLLGRPTRVAHFDQPAFAWR